MKILKRVLLGILIFLVIITAFVCLGGFIEWKPPNFDVSTWTEKDRFLCFMGLIVCVILSCTFCGEPNENC